MILGFGNFEGRGYFFSPIKGNLKNFFPKKKKAGKNLIRGGILRGGGGINNQQRGTFNKKSGTVFPKGGTLLGGFLFLS